jgi:phosphoglycolate phosphatase
MAADRDALAVEAAAEARRRYGVGTADCIVVGDTIHDVRCARAAGARAVAVATGGSTRAALAAVAPDLLLDDLTDADGLLAWAAGLDGRQEQT